MKPSKKLARFGGLTVGVAVGIMAVVLLSGLRRSSQSSNVTTSVLETSKPELSPDENAQANAGIEVVKTGAPAIASNPAVESTPARVTAERGDSEGRVEVRADQVLAKVNGVAIMLKDLLPIGTGEGNQSLSAERYDFVLRRAIARELTFQAAQAQGIKLTEEQNRQLNQVRDSMMARYGSGSGKVIHLNVTGTLDDRIEFELRDAASPLLLDSMLAKAGAASPYVTEGQVEEYYRTHLNEYGALPESAVERQAAWQKIDLEIRNRLLPEIQAQYQHASDKMLEQLRTSASVTLMVTAN